MGLAVVVKEKTPDLHFSLGSFEETIALMSVMSLPQFEETPVSCFKRGRQSSVLMSKLSLSRHRSPQEAHSTLTSR